MLCSPCPTTQTSTASWRKSAKSWQRMMFPISKFVFGVGGCFKIYKRGKNPYFWCVMSTNYLIYIHKSVMNIWCFLRVEEGLIFYPLLKKNWIYFCALSSVSFIVYLLCWHYLKKSLLPTEKQLQTERQIQYFHRINYLEMPSFLVSPLLSYCVLLMTQIFYFELNSFTEY